jgi:hypothetical protein
MPSLGLDVVCIGVTPRPPCGRDCYSWQLSRISRLAPQINTSLFCALCPHSCTSRKDIPVDHPSSDRSRPSMLNLEFFSDELPKRRYTLLIILSILLSPEPGCHTLNPLEDRCLCQSTSVPKLPLLDPSMRPVPAHVPRRATCPHT